MKTSVSLFAVLLLIGGFMFYKNNSLPDELGVMNGQLAPVPSSPNGVSSQTQVMAKQVPPLPFQGNLQDSKNKIVKIIGSYPGAHIITQKDTYIHSVFTTPTMHFKDDVEFYFDELQQVVHFRSASRVGYSDMGMNLMRYQEIKKSYEGEE